MSDEPVVPVPSVPPALPEPVPEDRSESIEQPAKVLRIGSMIKKLLDEVKAAPLDEGGRSRMSEIYATSIEELASGLSPDLREELERITEPFSEEVVPTDAELRIAQAQLVGWLEGLFHGYQAAMLAQQMAVRADERGLPGDPRRGDDEDESDGPHSGTGYL